MLDSTVLATEKTHFWQHGFVVVRGMFSGEEMDIVRRKITSIRELRERVASVREEQAKGEHPSFETIFVWNDVLGEDLFAKLGRSYKLLDRLSYYFDDDVYGYHNKIALKYPGIVGFRAHQDYAYWKGYGCRFPEAHAAFIAIDSATQENGCLKLVPRSHLLGTLPHGTWSGRGSDNGILPEALAEVLAGGYEYVPIPAESGDVILFHGNTIHGSEDNHSELPRLAMIATMNTKRNSPDAHLNRPGHPYWSHQQRVREPVTEADLARPLPNFALRYDGGARTART